MEDRQAAIRKKGFDMMAPSETTNFARIKMPNRIITDASINLDYYDKSQRNGYHNKKLVIQALMNNDVPLLRKISAYFYRTNGIYQKIVNYFATMYRYDWYTVPEIFSDNAKEDVVTKEFKQLLDYFDNSHIKKISGDMALQVIRDGVYYGYACEGEEAFFIQELPWKYCRSRFSVRGVPAIEFNMAYFDVVYPDTVYRMQVLDYFPDEFKEGYILYKQGKLPCDCLNDDHKGGHWYLLDPTCAFKLSIGGTNDLPLFVNAIPEIIDLDFTQGIDRQRQLQKLLKIIVQKLPLDKNGDLIFDVDEARDIHNNAVDMLADAIGVDVLTTFTEVKDIAVSDANATVTDNSLDNAERTVYNALGVSKNLFNTDGNLSLEKSILADEGSIRDLILQLEYLYDAIAQKRSKNKKKYNFRLYLLHTTQYNYQALAKLYKEQTTVGFSKMLPQIALGQSQSFILNTALFENDVLHLSEIMIPPMMSSTMSGEDLRAMKDERAQTTGDKSDASAATQQQSTGQAGRPAKEEGELSEKTIQNKESMS